MVWGLPNLLGEKHIRKECVMRDKLINNVVGGRYFVLDIVGTGGSAKVYKVRDVHSGKYYALKKYRTSNPNDKTKFLEGIERELDVLKYTAHPVLPKIFNLIRYQNDIFLVMEYVEGTDLKQYIKQKGVLRKRKIIDIMTQICSGLYYLHSLEPAVVYRDLKPSNIILKADGTVKLVDFGIAKRYSKEIGIEELAVGSKGFAAPEQFGNESGRSIYNTDIRTDIYTVGTTMYYLRTGKRMKKDKFDIRIGRKMRRVISKCTKTNPDDRYQNCIDLLCDIKSLA